MGLFKKKKDEEFEEASVPNELEAVSEEQAFNEEKNEELQEVKNDEEKIWNVKEVATSTEPVVFNSKNNKVYRVIDAICEILNRTEQ